MTARIYLFPPAWAEYTIHDAARWTGALDGKLQAVSKIGLLELVPLRSAENRNTVEPHIRSTTEKV